MEVNPNFYSKFKNELGQKWNLGDADSNTHHVSFNNSFVKPLLTVGWDELQTFYNLIEDHVVMLSYKGPNNFLISVFKQPAEPFNFPLFHNLSAKPERKRYQVSLTPGTTSTYQLVKI